MALVTTTASLIRQYNAFTGLSALERSQSGIARAEIVYYNVNDTWPGTGAGDNRVYQTGDISLPKDFGYVITDAFMQISRDGSDGLYPEGVAALRISPGGVLGPQINTQLTTNPSRQDSAGTTAIGSIQANRYNANTPFSSSDSEMTYILRDKPTALIYPFGSSSYTSTPNPASIFNLQVGENVLNNPGNYSVSIYLRFLQYDIDQSYNYVIQSPQLTR
jgi:hypothetical protein